jgi:hypothetical protein
MSNYLVWHDHGDLQLALAIESNRNKDDKRMDYMIADIGREYDLGPGEQPQPPEVQNFYMRLATSTYFHHFLGQSVSSKPRC